MAERGGFEPPVEISPYDGLANRCFRPLSHLSVRSLLVGYQNHNTTCRLHAMCRNGRFKRSEQAIGITGKSTETLRWADKLRSRFWSVQGVCTSQIAVRSIRPLKEALGDIEVRIARSRTIRNSLIECQVEVPKLRQKRAGSRKSPVSKDECGGRNFGSVKVVKRSSARVHIHVPLENYEAIYGREIRERHSYNSCPITCL